MWASQDTEDYLAGYPGVSFYPPLQQARCNLDFYLNRIPSEPDGDFVDVIHAEWRGDHGKVCPGAVP